MTAAMLLVASLAVLAAPALWAVFLRAWPARPFYCGPPFASVGGRPLVSVLIPAHNEARVLRAKIENTLMLRHPGMDIEIIVGSDGSSDGTDDIANDYPGTVRLIRNEMRAGKSATLNRIADAARGHWLLVTDASARLDDDALVQAAVYMADARVAVTAMRYVVDGGAVESSYWAAEARLRAAEAERDALLGVSGAGYLVRRATWIALPNDTINDDFVLPLELRARGHRIAYAEAAVARDEPTRDGAVLHRRRRRIAAGNVQMLRRYAHLLSPAAGRIAAALWLHKAVKSLAPAAVVGATAAAAGIAAELGAPPELSAGVTAAFVTAVLGAARLNYERPGAAGTFGQAAGALVAYTMGTIDGLLGRTNVRWRRADENEPPAFDGPAPVPARVAAVKRAVDVVGALVGLALLWPLMAIVALAVRVGSPGPALYAQERVGVTRDGRPTTFRMYKFRSMYVDAESRSGPVWAGRDDPRITPVGRVLRKMRLDELPQLVNVLRGEMSLVGPRPERPCFTTRLDAAIAGYGDRVCALKPGITGWAQVHCEYDTSFESVRDKLGFDLAYAAHLYGLMPYLHMEVRVLAKTVGVVMFGKGAH